MSKRAGVIAAIFLLSVPAIASAKDKPDQRVQALVACEYVSSSEERLRCHDQSIQALKGAFAQGSVVLKEKKAPLAREGIIKASGISGEKRFWVLLENGDRWAIYPSAYRREPPLPGTPVKLRKTLKGNYLGSPDLNGLRAKQSSSVTGRCRPNSPVELRRDSRVANQLT